MASKNSHTVSYALPNVGQATAAGNMRGNGFLTAAVVAHVCRNSCLSHNSVANATADSRAMFTTPNKK